MGEVGRLEQDGICTAVRPTGIIQLENKESFPVVSAVDKSFFKNRLVDQGLVLKGRE